MKKRLTTGQICFMIALFLATVIVLRRSHDHPFQENHGKVFGTLYSIKYQSDNDLQLEIERAMQEVDDALSPFNEGSIISAINRGEAVEGNDLFMDVFRLAKDVYAETDGAFDITIAPLVNAWGFGFRRSSSVDSCAIDSIRQFVGFDRVKAVGNRIVKEHPETMLDCSAIAKGYGVDHVAKLLEAKGVKNFMVEIGGEIVVRGTNPKGDLWRVGVNKPVDDSLSLNQELQTILTLTDKAMATSGNYRNFYYKDGKKFAHTIDPRLGYPIQQNILSATVVAADCATADAYATAFMVLGMEEAKAICQKHPELGVYLIYVDDDGTIRIYHTDNIEPSC